MDGRGQTFTLEAFVAAILLFASVAFALQVVSVSANTAGAGDTQLRNSHVGLATGVLDQSASNGSLQATVVSWNESTEQFHDADDDEAYYITKHPPTAFGAALGALFDERQVRYDIDLYFTNASGERERQRLVQSGTPDDNAVKVAKTVTLYDDTRLVAPNGTRRSTSLADVEADPNAEFYAPDARPDGPVYNVVRVEVVLWEV